MTTIAKTVSQLVHELEEEILQLRKDKEKLQTENTKLKHYHKEIDEKTQKKIKHLEVFYHITRSNLLEASKHIMTIEKEIHENNLDQLVGSKIDDSLIKWKDKKIK